MAKPAAYPQILHHGAVSGVTGSCHELKISQEYSVLIDCGLFQGAETSPQGSGSTQLEIDFPIEFLQALLVTHCHIDHVGRIPYLMAAGFRGPIYCSAPTAELLPLVLEDAVEIGFTRNGALVRKFLKLLKSRIKAVPYNRWESVSFTGDVGLKVRFKPAGHILGSSYIECDVDSGSINKRIVFSGDLGGPFTPLLPNPKPPYKADILILESTYGDRLHTNRKQRKEQLKERIAQCLLDKGVILIPAFSIGRTQELLYELEEIIHQGRDKSLTPGLEWDDLEIIVDSPLANQFTEVYKKLRPYWDAESRVKVRKGRHPLAFEQLTTVNTHQDHLNTVAYLKKTARPCIVLAASGMCSGGRIVNYLKELIEEPRTDILFVGYQAAGTPGRIIQQNGPTRGYIEFDHRRYSINAGVHTLSGYSAHADQNSLIRFVSRMRKKPDEIRLIHGDNEAKMSLKQVLNVEVPESSVLIPEG